MSYERGETSQVVSTSVIVRSAVPADVPVLLRMKRAAAIAEHAASAVQATEVDWLRDGFGPGRRFHAFVAEAVGTQIGMATCGERYSTGLGRSAFVIIDLYVEPAWRGRKAGRMLLAMVAAAAVEAGVPALELLVRRDNPARNIYRAAGFRALRDHLAYSLTGAALTRFAASRDADPACSGVE